MNWKGLQEGKKIANRIVKIWKSRDCGNSEFIYPSSVRGEKRYEKLLRRFRKTKVPCSCFMCKWEKKVGIPTKQEMIAREREKEQIEDVLNENT